MASTGSLVKVRNKDGLIIAVGKVTITGGDVACTVTHHVGTPPNFYHAEALDDLSGTGGPPFIDTVGGTTLNVNIFSATPGTDHTFLVTAWYIAGGN